MIRQLCLVVAALMGASGVALAALAAHASAGSGLDAAAHLLLFHAVAIMAATALAERGAMSATLGQAAILGWAIGASLFALDIALRTFAGFRLFPMAAPIGGGTLIVSWLAMAAAFGHAARRDQP